MIFIFTITFLPAQTDFRPGYVIKAIGDTLWGSVDYRGSELMGKICTFRNEKDGTVSMFTPNQIVAYRFKDGKYYVSETINGKKVFLEYLINGRLNIYYLNNDSGEHFFFNKVGMPIEELPYEEEIIEKDGLHYLNTSTKHIRMLTYYLQDAPEIQDEINNLQQPDYENLIALAKSYHNAVCNGDKCIIYEKKLPAFKINPEIVVGVNSFFQNGFNSVVQLGVLGHIWMPRTSEKLYLKIGFSYLPLIDNADYKAYLIKLPVQLEYLYPKGKIRPRFALGVNFYTVSSETENLWYSEPFYTTVISAGTEVQLSKSLYLTTNCELDFYDKISIIPRKVASLSLSVGVNYHL